MKRATSSRGRATTVAVALWSATAVASAQPLGTFKWQLQPYCNVVTVAVTQTGAVYELEGTDDQCGDGTMASVVGTAFPNPNGTIGLGLSVIATPGGRAIHVDATITLPGASGTWRDSTGATGAFALTPGAGTGGSPRPPTAGLVGSGNIAQRNAAFGPLALTRNPDSRAATAVGYGALQENTTGELNTAVGSQALLNNTSGGYNTAVGSLALLENRTSHDNTAVGFQAMRDHTSGDYNVAVGAGALGGISGSRNVAVGESALLTHTGTDTIGIGYLAGFLTPSGSNNIYIGSQGFGPDNNQIRIGNPTHQGAVIGGIAGQTSSGGVPVLVNAGGRLGTSTSSSRFKEHVEPIANAQDVVQALRPVTFRYKPEFDDGSRLLQYGLIAEDVADVAPSLVVRDDAGAPQTVRYHFLTPLLIAEVQRLQRELEALRDELAARRTAERR